MLGAFDAEKSDNFFKLVKNVTGASNETEAGGSNVESYDYFAPPAEKEVFGSRTYATTTEYYSSQLAQFTWYKTSANQKKDKSYWLRTPVYLNDASYAIAQATGAESYAGAASAIGFSFFGCL
jgi:hypothetical protein